MTEEQFLRKVKNLAKDVEQLIVDRAERMIKSGHLNLNLESEGYRLAKLFIIAMASEIEGQYSPRNIGRKDRTEITNLKRFI